MRQRLSLTFITGYCLNFSKNDNIRHHVTVCVTSVSDMTYNLFFKFNTEGGSYDADVHIAQRFNTIQYDVARAS